jgi:hypothetical protein
MRERAPVPGRLLATSLGQQSLRLLPGGDQLGGYRRLTFLIARCARCPSRRRGAARRRGTDALRPGRSELAVGALDRELTASHAARPGIAFPRVDAGSTTSPPRVATAAIRTERRDADHGIRHTPGPRQPDLRLARLIGDRTRVPDLAGSPLRPRAGAARARPARASAPHVAGRTLEADLALHAGAADPPRAVPAGTPAAVDDDVQPSASVKRLATLGILPAGWDALPGKLEPCGTLGAILWRPRSHANQRRKTA